MDEMTKEKTESKQGRGGGEAAVKGFSCRKPVPGSTATMPERKMSQHCRCHGVELLAQMFTSEWEDLVLH